VRAAERTTLGNTSVEVSGLSLGGAPFGEMFQAITDDQVTETVHRAYDLGVRHFDTAPRYGNGESERRLGGALRDLPRHTIIVSTKVAPAFGGNAHAIDESLQASLGRSTLDHFDIVHVHDPDDHMDDVLETTFPRLRMLQAEGAIGAVGAGMNHAAPLARLVAEGVVDCVLLAGRWTLLDQSALDDLLPLSLERNVAVVAAGVFNSGVLADPDADPTLANFFYRPAPTDVLERVRRIRAVCETHGVSLGAAALQFPLTHPAVASVLVGCRSPQEVEINAANFEVDIPPRLWRDLADHELLRRDALSAR
jgi:D-threo-aldose 1-dehydrogenase